MVSQRFRSRRVLLCAGLLGLGLLAGPFTVHGAGATFSTCDTDPIVLLSNGAQVTLAAHIGVDTSGVQGVTYVLHGPSGLSVTGVTYDGGPVTNLESVQYVPDNGYYTDTLVQTAGSGVSVTVTTNVSLPGGGSWYGSASGQSNQHMVVGLSH